ncbi:DUF6428 family protein [Poritiphilus flavus]|uniref:Uncharacterized protein n=1 Tax=Poritiphilus flavus TaxID=2697053 RepID=A0A6L9E7T4_9FLAO|nr:DUF6428 family protein [Poritiphilus flavus]NAS10668.1 hypothetical protein [Poritiphilus flavus]
MKTGEFLSLLRAHQNKSLLFDYRNGALVGANYHITEVKNIHIDAVDCGARTDTWKETVVQLWESPKEIGKTEYMTTYKALSILNRVGRMKPMEAEAELKFEYSNDGFHTAQLYVQDVELSADQFLVRLSVQKTDCKAKDACGVPESKLVGQAVEAGCNPESGCC